MGYNRDVAFSCGEIPPSPPGEWRQNRPRRYGCRGRFSVSLPPPGWGGDGSCSAPGERGAEGTRLRTGNIYPKAGAQRQDPNVPAPSSSCRASVARKVRQPAMRPCLHTGGLSTQRATRRQCVPAHHHASSTAINPPTSIIQAPGRDWMCTEPGRGEHERRRAFRGQTAARYRGAGKTGPDWDAHEHRPRHHRCWGRFFALRLPPRST
jgi:hypothetical protein